MYHASITNSDKWSIILSCQSNSSLTAFVTEDFTTVPTMMLQKRNHLDTLNFTIRDNEYMDKDAI
jgi:hypothetical protein